jgi:hypothetical protein
MGTLTFWKPLGHSRPVTGLLYLYVFKENIAMRLGIEFQTYISVLYFSFYLHQEAFIHFGTARIYLFAKNVFYVCP